MKTRILYLLLSGIALSGQATINTIAGNQAAGFGGDGGPAAQATLNRSVYVHVDVFDNIYVADEGNRRVRKIDRNGIITTFAGNGSAGFAGDGGPATQAALNGPNGVCSDASGNIFINDTLNQRIRKVDRGGTITTFAGTGAASSGGSGGPATSTALWLPIRCDFDAQGNLYFAEQGGHKIRKIDTNGTITTLAGSGFRGFSGDNGPAAASILDNPTSIAVDYSGNIYFSDQSNQRIRRISSGGVITTYAGNGISAYAGENVSATAASMRYPGGIAIDQRGNLYIAESLSQRIRRVTPGGIISTIAGTGAAGFTGDGGPATAAQFNEPFGIDLDSEGNIYIADTLNNRIRRISPVASSSAPVFESTRVQNAASYAVGLTPGGLATIFGDNLSAVNGIVVTQQAPWPQELSGVSVTVNGTAARLYHVIALNGREQVSFQVPFEAAGSGSANVILTRSGVASGTVSVPVLATQPGIFAGVAFHANYTPVTAASPARRGEALLLFLTGMGSVSPAVATGAVAPSAEPFARTVALPTVRVGAQTGALLYSGLAPGYIGLYQVNFTVPDGAPLGALELNLSQGGPASNVVMVEVR